MCTSVSHRAVRAACAAGALFAGALGASATAQSAVAQSSATPPPSARTNAAVAELPSIQLPAALDRVLRDYEAAWSKGDATALAALFAEDGFVMQSGKPPARGRAAIRAAYSGQGGSPLRLRALAASVADTVGYIIGAYGYGDAPGDAGKFTLTLRRSRNATWLIYSDMDNASRRPN